MMLSNAVLEVNFAAVYEYIAGFSLANARKATSKDLAVVCPFHNDTHPSMNLDVAGKKWYCPVCQRGGGVADFIIAANPVGYEGGYTLHQRRSAAFAWLRSRSFAREDLRDMPSPTTRARSGFKRLHNERCLTFDYTDARGELRMQVLRFEGTDDQGQPDKYFRRRYRLPEGAWREHGDTWDFVTAEGEVIARVPYWKDEAKTVKRRKPSGPWASRIEHIVPSLRAHYDDLLLYLPDVVRTAACGGTILLVEGEKKAKRLRERLEGVPGYCATTIPNGAGADLNRAWLQAVAGASRLWSLADSDPDKDRRDPNTGVVERFNPGRDAAWDRAAFFRRVVFDVRVIDFFPDRFDGSDVEEWLDERPRVSGPALMVELEAIAASAPSAQ